MDGKRRKELKDLFAGCNAGLVFVTAFENRRTMQTFVSQIAWESGDNKGGPVLTKDAL